MAKHKLIVIVGPTASGKTGLAVDMARQTCGEVISADSRQVYKGFDLGSGKVTKREMKGVPHHCLDICSPRYTCSAELWCRHAERAVRDIVKRGKLPIVAGGTGFYIDTLVYGTEFPRVKPNLALRTELARLSPDALITRLTDLDPQRARTIEHKNPRRLIRAIEIATTLGYVPLLSGRTAKFDTTWIGLDPGKELLEANILKRLQTRLRQGMVAEVEHLHKGTHQAPLSWKRLERFGLEYRYIAQYLQHKISKEEMCAAIERDSMRYARRQMTWFRRNKEIRWYASANEAVRAFK